MFGGLITYYRRPGGIAFTTKKQHYQISNRKKKSVYLQTQKRKKAKGKKQRAFLLSRPYLPLKCPPYFRPCVCLVNVPPNAYKRRIKRRRHKKLPHEEENE